MGALPNVARTWGRYNLVRRMSRWKSDREALYAPAVRFARTWRWGTPAISLPLASISDSLPIGVGSVPPAPDASSFNLPRRSSAVPRPISRLTPLLRPCGRHHETGFVAAALGAASASAGAQPLRLAGTTHEAPVIVPRRQLPRRHVVWARGPAVESKPAAITFSTTH
jgi:hypothetical protein